MPYQFRSKCCDNPDPCFTENVEISGTAWRDVNFDFDTTTGEFTYDTDSPLADIYNDDVWGRDYECANCGKIVSDLTEQIEVVDVDTEGEVVRKGRYWCDYCYWQGNFPEDHPDNCTFSVNGPRQI